ncbi:neurensin-1 isoform X2 [Hylobates moloch]|uniref:neurensin-1 isoform X2 n=1 Tax=Hylobates moloch TaxID=81572 RepID=UPI0026762120|nr:neurensin-1 isoform X2 [Hylobates moloch]
MRMISRSKDHLTGGAQYSGSSRNWVFTHPPTAKRGIGSHSTKTVLAAVSGVCHHLERPFSVTTGIGLTTPRPQAALLSLEDPPNAFQLFCVALNKAALLPQNLKQPLHCNFLTFHLGALFLLDLGPIRLGTVSRDNFYDTVWNRSLNFYPFQYSAWYQD